MYLCEGMFSVCDLNDECDILFYCMKNVILCFFEINIQVDLGCYTLSKGTTKEDSNRDWDDKSDDDTNNELDKGNSYMEMVEETPEQKENGEDGKQ